MARPLPSLPRPRWPTSLMSRTVSRRCCRRSTRSPAPRLRRVSPAAVSPGVPIRAGAWTAGGKHLTPQGRQQSLADIGTDLASTQVAMKDIAARQSQSQVMLQNLVDQSETVSSDQVATELLALQTRLQASYQTTAMLAQLSLVKYLPVG